MSEIPDNGIDLLTLKKISAKTFRCAKIWYRRYICTQLIILVFAVSSLFFDFGAKISTLITLVGIIVLEFIRWLSDDWKSHGEWAKRKIEIADGFGSSVDNAEITNWLVNRPADFLDDVNRDEISGSEFAAKQKPGARRVVENTRESAWWSKFLARQMVFYLAVLVVIFVLGSCVALTVSICELSSSNNTHIGVTVQTVGCIICSVLGAVLSINVFRLASDYRTFSSEAEKITTRCSFLLASQNLSELEACDVLHDYQIARSAAPLIPTWVWKCRKDHLNKHWQNFCKK